MNAPSLISLTLLMVALAGCDKVKNAAQQAVGAVNKGVKERLEDKQPESDEALANLVDQNEEGVVFRKDLPFPQHIRILSRIERRIEGRVILTTETGQKKVEEVNGKETLIKELEREGNRVRCTIKESGFAVSGEDAEQGATKVPNPMRRRQDVSNSLNFVLTDKGWTTADKGDFRAMALSQQLGPVFEDLLVQHGLRPRPLWFSKRRIQIGDEIEISGELLPLLWAGEVSGGVTLRLVKLDAVHGHPCGMFEISGDYHRQSVASFDGSLLDEEVAIESGHIWLSLIHPVILRQELVTIQSFKPSEEGAPGGRGQGQIKVSIEREWRALDD